MPQGRWGGRQTGQGLHDGQPAIESCNAPDYCPCPLFETNYNTPCCSQLGKMTGIVAPAVASA